MVRVRSAGLAILAALSATGCVTQPTGPTVMVMPAPGKPFDVFQGDDAVCRQFAAQQTAGGAQQANSQEVGTAVVGTALGAAVGAAAGGGRGAAVGAATGAAIGTVAGAAPAAESQYMLQRRYDAAYEQCMYGRGNWVPGMTPPAAAPPPPPPPPYQSPPRL